MVQVDIISFLYLYTESNYFLVARGVLIRYGRKIWKNTLQVSELVLINEKYCDDNKILVNQKSFTIE